MALRRWPFAPTDFARSRLMLSSVRAPRRRVMTALLVLFAFVAGAALAHFYETQVAASSLSPPSQHAAEAPELAPLRQALDQSRLQLQVAEARGHELERQIDALNQQLRASQEELTFFRKTRDTKR